MLLWVVIHLADLIHGSSLVWGWLLGVDPSPLDQLSSISHQSVRSIDDVAVSMLEDSSFVDGRCLDRQPSISRGTFLVHAAHPVSRSDQGIDGWRVDLE